VLIGMSSTRRNLDDQRVLVTRLDVLLCIEAIVSVISILHNGRSCYIETTTYQPILAVTNLLSFIINIVFSLFVSVVVQCNWTLATAKVPSLQNKVFPPPHPRHPAPMMLVLMLNGFLNPWVAMVRIRWDRKQ
jgi:H+/Cl- antiporter ClcA